MGDGGIGDSTFSEVERRKMERSIPPLNYLMRDKHDYARRRFMAEDPVHGPVLGANDKAERCRTYGYLYGGCAGLFSCLMVDIMVSQAGSCFLGLLGIPGLVGIVGGNVGYKYGRRKYQVDTLDTVTAEAKFQEWFVKNETLIPTGNEKFLKWLEKNRMAAQFRELYKKA